MRMSARREPRRPIRPQGGTGRATRRVQNPETRIQRVPAGGGGRGGSNVLYSCYDVEVEVELGFTTNVPAPVMEFCFSFSLSLFPCRKATRPNGEWRCSTRRHMLKPERPETVGPDRA